MPFALKGISFRVGHGEKIGVVGRTGSGKSSLLYALFRLTDCIHGDILIDGVSSLTVPLETLRSKISVIPQDPVLFSGSIRYNLDPFSQYSDDAVWSALEDVQLKNAVSSMPHGIQETVSESGGNLSVGQRQLICLARAVLRYVALVICVMQSMVCWRWMRGCS
jgi:ABC-type multidrug transport system fused ATPase/permease subunit